MTEVEVQGMEDQAEIVVANDGAEYLGRLAGCVVRAAMERTGPT